ncbi:MULTISPECIES: MerR family DNA-binding protein [unclassified Moraxella]|uniref:MerR family DNA-binding protein n=1 Tax=unclassified Moraxella TaxID=2685852 RepID=UPI003AF5C2A7
MNINEVTKLTGLSARQIREYEKLGLLQSINRTESGYRIFNQPQITRLQFIKHARDVEFSLAQIQALLSMQDNQQRNNADVKALTGQHIEDLNQKIERLQAMKSTLQAWHDSCMGDGSPQCRILEGLMMGNACHKQ